MKERLVGDFVREMIRDGRLYGGATTCPMAASPIALAEMAIASGIGAEVQLPGGADPIRAWFGEDQSRYVVTVSHADPGLVRDVQDQAAARGVPALWIGETGGTDLKLAGARALPVADLKAAHEGWFPRFMGD
jgi:phosphoribosylformylglycinamidine (FGAM) synthase-like enzyme